jgi:hypothetical protein
MLEHATFAAKYHQGGPSAIQVGLEQLLVVPAQWHYRGFAEHPHAAQLGQLGGGIPNPSYGIGVVREAFPRGATGTWQPITLIPSCSVTSSILGNTGRFPFFIAVDSGGNIYTTNSADDTVTKIEPDGTTTLVFAITGDRPVGIAVDSGGNIYTANSNSNTVTKIVPTIPTPTITLDFARTGPGPYGIAVDSNDNIYTANSVSDNVTKITTC